MPSALIARRTGQATATSLLALSFAPRALRSTRQSSRRICATSSPYSTTLGIHSRSLAFKSVVTSASMSSYRSMAKSVILSTKSTTPRHQATTASACVPRPRTCPSLRRRHPLQLSTSPTKLSRRPTLGSTKRTKSTRSVRKLALPLHQPRVQSQIFGVAPRLWLPRNLTTSNLLPPRPHQLHLSKMLMLLRPWKMPRRRPRLSEKQESLWVTRDLRELKANDVS